MTRWYDGVSPVSAVVSCRGERHRLTWRRGRIVAEAHDLGAERALAALGGGRCSCVELATACQGGLGVDDLFLLWTEQAEPSVGTSQALERWMRRAGAASRSVREPLVEERRSALLASLPLELRRRLALGVFRAVAREPDRDRSASHPGFAPIFASLLQGAVRRSALADRGDLHWRLAVADGRAVVEPWGRGVALTLSAGWVADVWAWGLAVVDGRLVAEATRRWSVDRVGVRVVAGEVGSVALAPAVAERRGGAWHLSS